MANQNGSLVRKFMVEYLDLNINHEDCQKVNQSYTYYNCKCQECVINALGSVIDGLKDFAEKPSHWFEDREGRDPKMFNLTDMCTAEDINNTLQFEMFEAITDSLDFGDVEVNKFFATIEDNEEVSLEDIRTIAHFMNENYPKWQKIIEAYEE